MPLSYESSLTLKIKLKKLIVESYSPNPKVFTFLHANPDLKNWYLGEPLYDNNGNIHRIDEKESGLFFRLLIKRSYIALFKEVCESEYVKHLLQNDFLTLRGICLQHGGGKLTQYYLKRINNLALIEKVLNSFDLNKSRSRTAISRLRARYNLLLESLKKNSSENSFFQTIQDKTMKVGKKRKRQKEEEDASAPNPKKAKKFDEYSFRMFSRLNCVVSTLPHQDKESKKDPFVELEKLLLNSDVAESVNKDLTEEESQMLAEIFF